MQKNEKKKLRSNQFFVFVSSMVEMVCGFILIALLTRSFGPSAMGTYFLAMALGGISQAFVTFGIYPVAVKELSSTSGEKSVVLITLLYIQTVIICLLALPMIFIVHFLYAYDPFLKQCIFLSIAFQVAVVPFVLIGSAVFQSFGKMYWDAMAAVLAHGIILFSVAWGIYYYHIGLAAVFIIICSGFMVKLLFSFFIITHRLVRIDRCTGSWALTKKYFNQCWPIGLHDIIMQGRAKIGIFMLEMFSSREQIAFFAAPFKLLSKTRIFAVSFVRPLLPYFSRLVLEKEAEALVKLYKKSFIILFTAGAGVALVLSCAGRFLVVLILGPEFQEAWVCFSIMSWLVPIMFVYFLTINLLYACEEGRAVLTGSIVSFIFICIMSYVLILNYQAVGASVAFLMAVVLLLLMVLVPAKRAMEKIRTAQGEERDEKQCG
ncbi:MAG: oligosaccharide flippase family protein [Desulfobacteraceae bacterium]